MSGHRPSRIAHDRVIQRAVAALPALPATFTAKDLRRQLPDRSPDQCRRLMAVLVARGYCRRSTKAAVEVAAAAPVTTLADRVLALFVTPATAVTIADAVPVVGGSYRAARWTLEAMEASGLLRLTLEPQPRPPHTRRVYTLAQPIPRASVAVPAGCRDPHCACPVVDSDYDVRDGRLVRAVCRRHELTREVVGCPS